MLKLGDQSISALRLGGTEIKKAYLGEAVVFAVTEPPEPVYYTVSASIDPAGSGTVTGAGTYPEGQTVTITASPEDGFAFTGWQEGGATVSESASYTFTVTGDRMLTAVFGAASRLPAGYTEVEYLSNGTNTSAAKRPYIIMPNTKAAVKMEIKFACGTANSSTYSYTYIYGYQSYGIVTYSKNIYYINGSSSAFHYLLGSQDIGVPHTLVCDSTNKNMIFDGTTVSKNPGTVWRTNSNYMFGTGSGNINEKNARIYSIKMWDLASDLVLEFVPCTNPSGVPGMYDRIGKTFYPNSNTASGADSFITGPAV